MTDFLGHLVDAPLANILIIAGLLFLGIGAVGRVTGKIEPDKMGRLMAGLLGLVLLTVGAVVHIRGDFSGHSSNTPPLPPVVHLTVTPPQIKKGDKVTLSWEVQNADDVELDPFGQVPPTGDRVIEPDQTTTYKLSATNKGGGKSGTFQEVIVDQPKHKLVAQAGPTISPVGTPPPNDGNNSFVEKLDPKDEKPVYASEQPPPLPVEDTQPSAPGDNYVWTPGSWYYDGKSDYYWVPGAWFVPPNANWLWTPPYWRYEGAGYRWHAGYWSTTVGFYGGIDYGFGYAGSGYDRSEKNSSSAHRVGYNGGLHGVQKTPAPVQPVGLRDRCPALEGQMTLARNAKNNRQQYSKVNDGHPLIVAVAKPPVPSPAPSPTPTPQPHPSPKPIPPKPTPPAPPKPIPPKPTPPAPPKPIPPKPTPPAPPKPTPRRSPPPRPASH